MDARTSTLSRICSSPIEAVFRAWTDPDAMQRFWTADPNWAIGDVRVDARRGGFYRVEFGLAGAKPLVDYGEFLTLLDPELVRTATITATLTALACWWGFAGYIHMRRDYFKD